ncbi:MAG: hypothetical protein IH819_07435 [Bacteroidetes bacterium]|nr:hypothetical protein [Bacteroidota bacterium]
MLSTRVQIHSAFVIDYYFPKKKSFNSYSSPSNPLTIIKYQILETSFVTIKVFDILGKQILNKKEVNDKVYQINNLNRTKSLIIVKTTLEDNSEEVRKVIY